MLAKYICAVLVLISNVMFIKFSEHTKHKPSCFCVPVVLTVYLLQLCVVLVNT